MMTARPPSLRPPTPAVARSERGASAVEYGLLIAGIAALVALAVYAFGGGVSGLFTDTCDKVTSTAGTASC